jgi:hypothetical protein
MDTKKAERRAIREQRKAREPKAVSDRTRLQYIAIRLEELNAERMRLKEERNLLRGKRRDETGEGAGD